MTFSKINAGATKGSALPSSEMTLSTCTAPVRVGFPPEDGRSCIVWVSNCWWSLLSEVAPVRKVNKEVSETDVTFDKLKGVVSMDPGNFKAAQIEYDTCTNLRENLHVDVSLTLTPLSLTHSQLSLLTSNHAPQCTHELPRHTI